ncbi:MAG: hypothetical protein V4478_02535 [Patescibacteria group bacterium]
MKRILVLLLTAALSHIAYAQREESIKTAFIMLSSAMTTAKPIDTLKSVDLFRSMGKLLGFSNADSISYEGRMVTLFYKKENVAYTLNRQEFLLYYKTLLSVWAERARTKVRYYQHEGSPGDATAF